MIPRLAMGRVGLTVELEGAFRFLRSYKSLKIDVTGNIT